MSGKIFNLLLLIAALISAAAAVIVETQIERARESVEFSNPGNINYLLQTDHTFDLLDQKLQTCLDSNSDPERALWWKEARHSFDILWSVFKVFKLTQLSVEQSVQGAKKLETDAQAFMNRYDPYFLEKAWPSDEVVKGALKETRFVNSQVHSVGLALFSVTAKFEDDLEEKLNGLYRYLVLAGLMLMVTGSLLILQLYRSSKRSQMLFEDAENSRRQLSDVVEELRSGKREKKARDNFLAAASHDLRQPLHALGLFVNALDNKVTTPDGTVILEKIRQSTEALNSLFNSLLDLSKLDAGVVEIDSIHFNVSDLFRNMEEEFSQTASQRSLEFSMSHADQILVTDYVLLSRIVRNLIDNAIVHTKSGSVIVECEDDQGSVVITVSDTGPGIPENEMEYIFSEYYQLDNPERDRAKGLGLGLSIVKRLTELLHIDLQVDSTPGVGTRFTVILPRGDASMVSRIEPILVSERYDLQGAVILVIDDEQEVREGMEMVLRENNSIVLSAESAEAARSQLVDSNFVPDLIVADYRLREGRTGIEAIELIRDELNLDVPAILITGDTSPARVRLAAESGLTLMHKPLVPDEMVLGIQAKIAASPAKTGSLLSDANYQ